MREATKSDRLKQVQFRMPPDIHKNLRKALLDDNISMADLFNKTAKEYIEKHNIEKQDGGNQDG